MLKEISVRGFYGWELWKDEKTDEKGFVLLLRQEPPFCVRSETRNDPDSGSRATFFELVVSCGCAPDMSRNEPVMAVGSLKRSRRGIVFNATRVAQDTEPEALGAWYSRLYALSPDVARELAAGPIEGIRDRARVEGIMRGRVSQRKAELVAHAIAGRAEANSRIAALTDRGVPFSAAKAAVKRYPDAAGEFAADPWKTGRELGMSFKACDRAADGFGVPADERRFEDMFTRVSSNIAAAGHTWAAPDTFRELCEMMSGHAEPEADAYVRKSAVVAARDGRIDFSVWYDTEGRIADRVSELLSRRRRNFNPAPIPDEGVRYSDRQREAFALMETTGVKILTGGPGTGKTTVTRGLVRYYAENSPGSAVKLAAPTGRAAQRLSEATGRPATTVHQLLEYRPEDAPEDGETGDAGFECRTRDNPIPAQLVVIDEMSMMNAEIFDLLCDAVMPGTTVLLVGDPDQLPPIGAGDILGDLIASGACEHVHLSQVFRQGEESLIVSNAGRIAAGDTGLATGDDFSVIRVNDGKEAADAVVSLVRQNHRKDDPFACQVLCPTRKGAAGTLALNARLQALLNPQDGGQKIRYGGQVFRSGDKMLTTVNNYAAGYFNGDVGTAEEVSKLGMTLSMRGERFKVTNDSLGEVTLAYAMTVHKSQGSEFDTVIVCLPTDSPGMLVNNLFYTAVTRAKKRVFVVTETDAMERSICTDSPRRRTHLAEMLSGKEKKAWRETH